MMLAASDCACELIPMLSKASFLTQVPEMSLAVAITVSLKRVPACRRVLASDIMQEVNFALFESVAVPPDEPPIKEDKSAHPTVNAKIENKNTFFMIFSFSVVNDALILT